MTLRTIKGVNWGAINLIYVIYVCGQSGQAGWLPGKVMDSFLDNYFEFLNNCFEFCLRLALVP